MVSSGFPVGVFAVGYLFFFGGVVIGVVAGALRDIF